MDSLLTSIMLTLIVATIELVVCLGCCLLLWRQREDVPDNSRRVLAAGAAFCVVSSLLKFRSIVASSVENIYTEVLSPGTCNLGLLSLMLIVAYAVAVVRPGWYDRRRIVLYILMPWLLLTGVYVLASPFQRLDSFYTMLEHIASADVLVRVLSLPYSFLCALLVLWQPVLRNSQAPCWIKQYAVGGLLMYVIAAAFVFTNCYAIHYVHQLYVAAFYLYFTHNELYRRTYVSEVIPYPEADADDHGYGRFQRFNELVEKERLYANPDLTRDDYARVMGVDRTTFSRIIIEQSGAVNMAAYLNAKRMAEAVRLMRQHPNYTLQAIMEESGYRSKMTFSRVFKDTYGKTPSEYRKSLE